jgi:hypothetical protein
MKITIEQLEAFVAKLNAHDWTYHFSDDHSVWKRGQVAEAQLKGEARTSTFYQEAYDVYSATVMGPDRDALRQAHLATIISRLENEG